MKLLASTILYFIMLLALPGCQVIETFQEFIKQSEAASTAIENQIGSRPLIGWNMENGRLTEVNVYFDNLVDKDITVAQIEQVVNTAIREAS